MNPKFTRTFFKVLLFVNIVTAFAQNGEQPQLFDTPEVLKEQIILYEKNGEIEKLVECYDQLATFYESQNQGHEAMKMMANKAITYEKAGQLEKAFETLNFIGNDCANKGHYAEAAENHDKALKIQQEINPDEPCAVLAKEYGELYQDKEKYDLSLKYFERSMQEFKRIGLDKEYLNTSIITADLFSLVGIKPRALEIYNEAKLFAKEKDYTLAISECDNGIGKIYSSLKDYEKALSYFKKAQEIASKNNFDDIEAKSYNNLAQTQINLKNLIEAESMALKASEILAKNEDKIALIKNLNLIGDIATKSKLFEKATNYYNKSQTLASQTDANVQYIENAIDKGQLLIEIKDFQKAIEQCIEAYELAKKNDLKIQLYNSCNCLATAYDKIGNTTKSYSYFQEFNELERSIFSTKKAKEIGKIEGKFEYKLLSKDKEFKIAKLEKENKTQKTWSKIISLATFAAILFSALLLRQFLINRKNHNKLQNLHNKLQASTTELELTNQELKEVNDKKKSLNTALEERNNELADLNKVYTKVNNMLQETNVDLEKANSGLSNFASIAAHDLKAPLRTISSFSNLLVKKNQKNLDEIDKEYFNYISTSTSSLQKMIDSLLMFSKIDKNLPESQAVDLNQIVEYTKANLNSLIVESKVIIETENLPTIEAHYPLIGQLFQNIINNAIKFRKKEVAPSIQISCVATKQPQFIKICIADNGIGIDKESLPKAFQLFSRFHKKSAYEGSGIGLSTCKKIVDFYGGNIWIESEVNVGTTVCFTLKK